MLKAHSCLIKYEKKKKICQHQSHYMDWAKLEFLCEATRTVERFGLLGGKLNTKNKYLDAYHQYLVIAFQCNCEMITWLVHTFIYKRMY